MNVRHDWGDEDRKRILNRRGVGRDPRFPSGWWLLPSILLGFAWGLAVIVAAAYKSSGGATP